MSQPASPQPRLNVKVPDDRVAGHYADFAGVWHTSETFVLDFLALSQPMRPDPENAGQTVADAELVSRVRVPAAQVWEIMKALEKQYSAWEAEQGRR